MSIYSRHTKWWMSCLLLVSVVILFFSYCGPQGLGGGRRGGSFINSPQNRPGFYTSGANDSSGNRNVFFKTRDILDNEEDWGTSAPLKDFTGAEFSMEAFEEFRLGKPVNLIDDIEDLRVYVRLRSTNNKTYSGSVTIAYVDWSPEDEGGKYTQFESGSGSDAKYNVWVLRKTSSGGTLFFHGFFQNDHADTEGALILVVDRKTLITMCDNADCAGDPYLVGGSVWIKNFRTTFNNKNSCNNHEQEYVYNRNRYTFDERIPTLSQRNKKCWYLSTGPYDCRTWRSGNGVDTYRKANPDDNCYTKLGSFEGLDLAKAFGTNDIGYIQESSGVSSLASRKVEFAKDHSDHPNYETGSGSLDSQLSIHTR